MVSFVIPAYDEERHIASTLVALHDAARAAGEPYEIIVVDDGSTDRTAAIATAQGARVVRVSHRQIAATRNAGARVARGDRLIFVDADTRVSGVVVRAALATMRAGAVGGGCAVKFDEPLPAWARILQPCLFGLQQVTCLAAGCFLFCTREAFVAAGGFDERVYCAEEIFMSRSLKRRGRFVVLRAAVLTSGRKLRAYSWREVFSILAALLARGPRSLESRDALDLWYGPRREDPTGESREKSA